MVLTLEDLYNKLFLTNDKLECIAWHVAAHNGNIGILHQLWEWAKELLTQDELNTKSLLAKNIWGRTVCCVAAVVGQLDILHKMWEWAKIK